MNISFKVDMGKKQAKHKVKPRSKPKSRLPYLTNEEVALETKPAEIVNSGVLSMPTPPPVDRSNETSEFQVLPEPPKQGFFARLFKKSSDYEKQLDKKETDINQRLELTQKKDFVMDKKAEQLKFKESDLALRYRELDEKRRTLDEREKMLEQNERDFQNMKRLEEQNLNNIKLQIDNLSNSKINLEADYLLRKKDTEVFYNTYTQRVNELKANQKLLGDMQREVFATVEKLEKTKKLLEQNEKEIVAKVRDLERHKVTVIKTERDVVSKIKDLEKLEKKIGPKERLLKEREDRLNKKEAELKKIAKYLEGQRKDLDSKLEKIRTVKELKASIPELKKQVATLRKEYNKVAAIDKEYKPINVDEDTDEELPLIQEGRVTIDNSQQENNKEIMDLISSTKLLIKNRKLSDARYQIYKLLTLYEGMSHDHAKRSSVYYEILDLKNNIELEELK